MTAQDRRVVGGVARQTLAIDGLRDVGDLGDPEAATAAVDAFLAAHDSPIVEGERATFLFRGEADEVRVEHRVVGLPPSIPLQRLPGTDLWYVVVHLPERSRVEYFLSVRRGDEVAQHNDPLNPHEAHNPMGSASVARATGYTVPAWAEHHDDTRHGELRPWVLESRHLGRVVHGQVYLPARFRTTHRYPLLVVHDGNDYLGFANAGIVLDNLVERLDVDEVVAIFLEPEDRLVEYAANPAHSAFLVEELVPQLEAELPLIGQPRGRAVMGASFGGIASFAACVHHPGFFGQALLQSTSFAVLDIGDDFGEGEVFRPVVEFLRDYRAAPERVADRMYVTCGAYEPMIRGNRAMVPVLRATGTQVRYVEAPDGHNWENWRDRLRDGLSWLYPGPQKFVYE